MQLIASMLLFMLDDFVLLNELALV